MFGFIDAIFPFMFGITFLIIIGAFVFIFVKGISTWSKNNASPMVDTEATVVAKRNHVSHHHNAGMDNMGGHTSTSYYVTFQLNSGDRMELQVDSREYGMLVEGDRGILKFQGTRYLEFERYRNV